MDNTIELVTKEIIEVCNKHGVVLSHEDNHGGFLFVKLSDLEGKNRARSGEPMVDVYHNWLKDADWSR